MYDLQDALDVYEKEVGEPLKKLEEKGKGQRVTLAKEQYGSESIPIYGFRRGAKPKVLLTACHHATEMFHTYHSIIDYLNMSEDDVIAVPVVDVPNFCHNKLTLEEILAVPKIRDEYNKISQVYMCIKDQACYFKKNCWAYGLTDCNKVTAAIANIIDRISGNGLIVDLHNWVREEYMIISKPTGRKGEERVINSVIKTIKNSKEKIYSSFPPGLVFSKVRDCVFKAVNETQSDICHYAKQRNVMNVAIEVPVFKEMGNSTQEIREDEGIREINLKLLKDVVAAFYGK